MFLFSLFAYLSMSQAIWAQGYCYDIWFDNHRDAMMHGMFTPGENELTLDLSAITSPGLHFLNIIPYFEWGVRGQWKCIPFLMPEGWPHTTDAKWVEYWVTAYDSKPKRLEYTGKEILLDIDISKMSYGLHFLNFRAFNEAGEAGPWKQIMFYISNGICDPEYMGYEYWIDDMEHVEATGTFPNALPIDIDLKTLSPGIHTFYFRAKNWFGGYGEQFSMQFEKFAVGDANGDRKVNITDAVGIVDIILNTKD